jgi:hypothetical protein
MSPIKLLSRMRQEINENAVIATMPQNIMFVAFLFDTAVPIPIVKKIAAAIPDQTNE